MKKWTALLLAALLALGAVGARADEGGELGAATLLVKERLGIGDGYEEFCSDSYEDWSGKEYWNLSWSGEQGSVYVTCDRQGEVYEYSRYDTDDYEPWSNDFAPRLVEETEEQYRPAAEAFLDKAVGGGFGWRLESAWPGMSNYRVVDFSFNGRLTRGGYDTDVSVSVTVRVRDKAVTGFWRGDAYKVYTAFEAPETPVDEAQARAALEAGLRMELRYEREGEGRAVLRYLPAREGSAYVNAADGALFEPDTGEEDLYGESAEKDLGMNDMAAEPASGAYLTEAELSGIREAEGLLPSEELDARARAVSEFGLDENYTLVRAATSRGENGVIRAVLRYRDTVDIEGLRSRYGMSEDTLSILEEDETFSVEKTVCLDARSGALLSLNTEYSISTWGCTYREMAEDEARAVAEAFLGAYFPERAGSLAAAKGVREALQYWYQPGWNFTFDRTENGIPYDRDGFTVSVNVDTGLVDAFSCAWEDDVAFEDPEGVIGADEARAIWLGQMETALRFVDSVDTREDYDATYKAVLCYTLQDAEGLRAVSARDGGLCFDQDGEPSYAYDDLDACPDREAIETLAAHGIGFGDGAFRPDEAVTLRDWLTLLLKAGEYTWIDASSDAELVSMARDAGVPLPGEDLSAEVSRAQAARMLIGMSGYGKAAPLREAFACGFADDDLLSDEDYGFVAIARAMGVAKAGADGRFRPADSATRAEAAVMLLAFLTRAV